jgi:hypothetical protein
MMNGKMIVAIIMMLVIVIVIVFEVLITRVMKMVVVMIVEIVGCGREENKFYKFPLNSLKYLC